MEVDNHKVYTWANQAGLDFFGDDVMGKEAAFYFEGEQSSTNSVQPLLDGQQDLIYIESWQRRKDGEKRPCSPGGAGCSRMNAGACPAPVFRA